MGRARYTCLKSRRCSKEAASAIRVFPVPATPVKETSLILGFKIACIAKACSALRVYTVNRSLFNMIQSIVYAIEISQPTGASRF